MGEPSAQPMTVLVVSGPDSPELEVLKALPPSVRVVGVGRSPADFPELSDEEWSRVNVLLNCGVGKNAGTRQHIQELWPRLTGLRWMHSCSAGIDHLLFDALTRSDVTLTNARGVYSHSLAEYTLWACKWFAMDYPRLAAAKMAGQWAPYDVEELRGRTMGIVGYGDIGAACARLARAFGMKVVALRRRTQLSVEEAREGLLETLYPPEELSTMLRRSDYVVCALPLTPDTHRFISADAISTMQPHAVFVSIGRGTCVDEEALVEVLEAQRIRGAALDVFYKEPLPEDSKLWRLPNVLLSPHCADRTREFQFDSVRLFVDNVQRYLAGQPLLNVCDKAAGY